jgi:hypothetical protein
MHLLTQNTEKHEISASVEQETLQNVGSMFEYHWDVVQITSQAYIEHLPRYKNLLNNCFHL